jgi:hypothetical protein
LIEHFVHGSFAAGIRFEDAEVLEIRKQRETDLSAHRGDLQFGHDQPQILDCAAARHAAVTDETGRFVVPLRIEEIDRVLQRAGRRVIVLRRDENETIERSDLRRPLFGVRLRILPQARRQRLVEQRQVVVFDVDELEFGVGALARDFVSPLGDGLTMAILVMMISQAWDVCGLSKGGLGRRS